ncbi:MAG: protein phosphatase 2C domain-containing protein [Rhodobacteraceae bacterium]|nr:protein phosphatase 2C domain-containing protein [Paracoccaceae bacterium]
MLHSAKFHYDASSALSQGQRDNQEDAIVADFPVDTEMGFAVLSDGMGGHASGDVASKIVVTEVFSELKLMAGDPDDLEQNIASVLREAAIGANECLLHHANASPESLGMGATLVAPVLIKDRLYWISIGDSPLYLFRNNELHRLNEDHSLTSQFDYLVSKGMMEPEEALNHPDRNCLTSVLVGKDIPKIDCPNEPIQLLVGDIVIAASDGLQFLAEEKITEVLEAQSDNSSAAVSSELLRVLKELNDPDQDNVSVCIIKVAQQQTEITKVQEPIALAAVESSGPAGQLVKSRTISAVSSTPGKKYLCRVSIERAAEQ